MKDLTLLNQKSLYNFSFFLEIMLININGMMTRKEGKNAKPPIKKTNDEKLINPRFCLKYPNH